MVDPNSGQTSGAVDSPPDTNSPSAYNDDDPAIHYVGKWVKRTNAAASGGHYHLAAAKTAQVQFSFSGTGFTWLTARGRAYGMASVVVDSVTNTIVDLYSRTNQFQYPVAVTGLTDAPHNVQILVHGTRDLKPHTKQVVFDGVTMP